MALQGSGVQPPVLEAGGGALHQPGAEAGPAAAWFSLEVEIAGAVYRNTSVSCAAQSAGSIQRDGVDASSVLRVISFELPCAYFKHLNDHPRFSKTVSRGSMSPPLLARPPHRTAAEPGGAQLSCGFSQGGGAELKPRIKGIRPRPGAWRSHSPGTLLPPSRCRLYQHDLFGFYAAL